MSIFENTRGQVSFETMMGMVVFLVFFIGIIFFTTSSAQSLQQKSDELTDKAACDKVAQAIFSARNAGLDWNGEVDRNMYLNNDTIYVGYVAGQNFSGVFCKTLPTGMVVDLNQGPVLIKYSGGFVFSQQ